MHDTALAREWLLRNVDPHLSAARTHQIAGMDGPSRTESAAKLEAIKAETAALRLKQLQGELLERSEVTRIGFTAFRILRDAMQNIGPRIAHMLAVCTDPIECERILTTEIDAALSTFTAEMLLSEKPDDDDDSEGVRAGDMSSAEA